MGEHMVKLEELVKDEDKIITVTSLAKDLRISIQEAQSLINEFVKDKSQELHLSYILKGTLKETGENVVCMVREDDLEEQKELLEDEPIMTIYSIQRSKNIDFNIISLIEKFDSGRIRMKALPGSVVSKNCVKRVLRKRKLPPLPPPTLKGKSSMFMKNPIKSEEKVKDKVQAGISKTEPKAKTQGGIANLFNKAATNKKIDAKLTSLKDEKKNSKSNASLSGFLSRGQPSTANATKQTNKNNEKETTKETKNKNEDIEEIVDVDFEDTVIETIINANNTEKATKPLSNGKNNESSTKTKKTKKRNRSASQDNSTKRRKRIIERNESDSDDMFASEEDEQIIDGTDDERERAPSPVVKKPLAPRNKKRKAINRTYEDEDGFIVTKTEFIYESASEDEVEVVKKVEAPKPLLIEKKQSSNSENEISPQVARKGKKGKKVPTANQPTLMNFFKRK